MSGSSTLRLCFAVMAPALTEAASARLKLQDTGTKHNKKHSAEPAYDATVASLSSSKKFIIIDTKQSDDTTGLSCGEVITRSPLNGAGRGGGLVTSTLSKKISCSSVSGQKVSLPAVNLIGAVSESDIQKERNSQIGSLVDASEDSSEKLLNGFKSMNQHPLKNNLLDLKTQFIVDSNSSAEKLRILASKISQSGMVSDDNGVRIKNEQLVSDVRCTASGDASIAITERARQDIFRCKKVGLTDQSSLQETTKMGMCLDNKINSAQRVEKTVVFSELEKPCDEMRKDSAKKQVCLERRLETLLRRLKRVQGKVVEKHAKEQLVQFVNYQHRNLQMIAKSIKREAPCPDVLKEHFLSNEDVDNMSPSQLVKLVRDHQSNKSLAISDRCRLNNSSAIVMSPQLQSQSFSAAERLSQKVVTAENDLDSDATASSSGGESGDEETSSGHDAALPPLVKRADWKWVSNRAAIVARWTWLQAQVSDLEYKIRQQSQVHRQLRNSKGGVVLGDPPTASDLFLKLQGLKCQDGVDNEKNSSETLEGSPYDVSALISNMDKQASRLSQSLNRLSPLSTMSSPGRSKLSSPHVSGSPSSSISSSETVTTTAENSPLISASQSSCVSQTHRTSSHTQPHLSPQSTSHDPSCIAARCRPLRSYRKRKILRTIDLYKSSVKAARLSDVRCRCGPNTNPCAMCGGRLHNTMPMDADYMSFNEKVALLDASFHPVLSFPEDVPLSIHYEAVIKSGLWQNKALGKRSKSGRESRRQTNKLFPLATSAPDIYFNIKSQGSKTQVGRTPAHTASSTINVTTKIKNKYEGKTKGKKKTVVRNVPFKPKVKPVKKKNSKFVKAVKRRTQEEDDDDELEALFLDQECGPSTSRDGLSNSASQSGLKDLKDSQRKRRAPDTNAYDINNIEIPHSIAASTRVEQIQYKEIVTPKWRVVNGSGVCKKTEELPLDTSLGKTLEKTNGLSVSLEHHGKETASPGEEMMEDLSDEAFQNRHSIPEQEEMKRFRNFLQYPPLRRGRARSDAFLSTADKENVGRSEALPIRGHFNNLPGGDATDVSLAVKLEDGTVGSSEMLNSSLPAYIQASEDSQDQSFSGRRRTSSSASIRRERRFSGASDQGQATSWKDSSVERFKQRAFPLSEEEYARMVNDSSQSVLNCQPLHPPVDARLSEPSGKVYVGGKAEGLESRGESRVGSPQNSETLSSVGDDPSDPDWQVGIGEGKGRPRSKDWRSEMVGDGDDRDDPDWNGSDAPRKGKKK